MSLFPKTIHRVNVTQRWSDAVAHNGTVHVVEVPTTLDGTIEVQTREVFAQLEATLALAGTTKQRLIMVTIYLKDMGERPAFNELWDAWLVPGTAPVRACVQVVLADPGYRLEIHAIAATP